jgi:hypothetical protein
MNALFDIFRIRVDKETDPFLFGTHSKKTKEKEPGMHLIYSTVKLKYF